ncbi:MAG TPA: hypothetical protein VFS21_31330 [Roseiflexaceae bacterium]|nr:hypothetical protein [Roseiflexaceae bacterium]
MTEPQHAEDHSLLITREALLAQIDARLSGAIGDKALAKWAFDRFYAEELGEEEYESEHAPLLAEALDELMFADDPHFRLSEEELRALAARLKPR